MIHRINCFYYQSHFSDKQNKLFKCVPTFIGMLIVVQMKSNSKLVYLNYY